MTPTSRDREDVLFRAALAAAAVFQVVQFWALPLVMSPDGADHISLAGSFGSASFLSHWNFVRGPLYPLLLRGALQTFGRNATAALLPGALLGFTGVCVLAAEVRTSVSPSRGAAVLLMLSPYPVLVAYEHTPLTEAGSFAALAIAVVVLRRAMRGESSIPMMCALGVVLALSYLYRSSMLSVIAGVVIVLVIDVWRKYRGSASGGGFVASAPALLGVFLVLAIPYGTVRLWAADGRGALMDRAFGYTALRYLVAQRVVPAGHAVLEAAADQYDQARLEVRAQPLSLTPIPESVSAALVAQSPGWRQSVRSIIAANPVGYAKAVGRSALTFVGWPGTSSENRLFTTNVLSLSDPGSKCVCPPQYRPVFESGFNRPGRRTAVQYALKAIAPLYVPLVLLGWGATLVTCVGGFRRCDLQRLALAIVPVSYAAAHVLLVLGTDRFAFPTFPLVISTLCFMHFPHPQRSVAPEPQDA